MGFVAAPQQRRFALDCSVSLCHQQRRQTIPTPPPGKGGHGARAPWREHKYRKRRDGVRQSWKVDALASGPRPMPATLGAGLGGGQPWGGLQPPPNSFMQWCKACGARALKAGVAHRGYPETQTKSGIRSPAQPQQKRWGRAGDPAWFPGPSVPARHGPGGGPGVLRPLRVERVGGEPRRGPPGGGGTHPCTGPQRHAAWPGLRGCARLHRHLCLFSGRVPPTLQSHFGAFTSGGRSSTAYTSDGPGA